MSQENLGQTTVYDLVCPMCERRLTVAYIEAKRVFSFYCEPCGVATPRVMTQFGFVTVTLDVNKTNLQRRVN